MNKLGVYGTPEMIRIHDTEQVKYPTEVDACAHILDPNAPRFTPAPVGPLKIWCTGCRALKLPSAFHRHGARPNGYQPYCKNCRKANRKAGKNLIVLTSERWHRG